MASKEQVQAAFDQLWVKYGNTLSLLSDSLDKMDAQEKRIKELEDALNVEPDFELNLSAPKEIEELEQLVLNRTQHETE